jgi:hypothetical protein
MNTFPRALALALVVLGSGCSVLIDSGRVQCSTDADCSKRGGEFADSVCVSHLCERVDPWSCAAHAPLVATSSAKLSVDFSMFDAIESYPVAGVRARVCIKLDFECKTPQDELTTGADGVIRFDVPPLFDGYVLVTGNDKNGDEYDPTMMFLPQTLEDLSLGAFPLTSKVASAGLAGTLGKSLEPGTGRVLATITGCDRQPTSGVALSGENMGDSAVGFYVVDGFPTFSASGTDSSGFAGFVNVSAGSVTLNAQREENGGRVGRVGVFIRPDYVSIRRIQPWTD